MRHKYRWTPIWWC